MKDDRVREELPGKWDINLDKAIETIKASQVTHSRASEMSEKFAASEEINAVKHKLKCPLKGKRQKSPSRKSLSPNKSPTKSKKVFVLWWYTCNEIVPHFRSNM